MRALPTGNQVTSFSIATNRVWKDKSGAKQESVEYHNVVVFGRQAETSAQYLRRGQQVYVEGRLQTRSWDDKTTGQKKYRTEIVADAVQFGQKSGTAPAVVNSGSTPQVSQPTSVKEELDSIEYPEEDSNAEDIPF